MAVTWEMSTLPNGLRVVTTPIPTTQAVSINMFVGVGSRSEEQEVNGITHFLEHMVFKGTERRPDATMIAGEIEGAGGTLNAYTNKEFTCYWNIVPFDRFGVGIDVLADMLLNSKLEQGEIDKERTVVQQELKHNHDSPGAWAARLIGKALYGEQPCGWDVGGSVELVNTMNRPEFVDHISSWYHARNHVLSVAGNVSHGQVMEQAERLFGAMPNDEIPSVRPYDPGVTGPRVMTDSRPIDQCSLYLGGPLFGRGDPDRFALRVMNDVLGSGMSSRLFREVRENRGLAYSVGSGYGFLADAGTFTISAGVDRDKIAETISVCLAECENMFKETVPADEMKKAKDHTVGRFRLSLETAYSLGQRHGELLISRGQIEEIPEFVAGIEAVTPDDVRRVASRIFDRSKFHCTVVGPNIDENEILAALS